MNPEGDALRVDVAGRSGNRSDPVNGQEFGVPYGSRTRVAAVKEKGPIVIQCNFAAWIALYRS
jgi:hypothetical protein